MNTSFSSLLVVGASPLRSLSSNRIRTARARGPVAARLSPEDGEKLDVRTGVAMGTARRLSRISKRYTFKLEPVLDPRSLLRVSLTLQLEIDDAGAASECKRHIAL
jgi:hypothetical protein